MLSHESRRTSSVANSGATGTWELTRWRLCQILVLIYFYYFLFLREFHKSKIRAWPKVYEQVCLEVIRGHLRSRIWKTPKNYHSKDRIWSNHFFLFLKLLLFCRILIQTKNLQDFSRRLIENELFIRNVCGWYDVGCPRRLEF